MAIILDPLLFHSLYELPYLQQGLISSPQSLLKISVKSPNTVQAKSCPPTSSHVGTLWERKSLLCSLNGMIYRETLTLATKCLCILRHYLVCWLTDRENKLQYTFDLKAAHDMWKSIHTTKLCSCSHHLLFPILYTQNDTWCRKGFAQHLLNQSIEFLGRAIHHIFF